MEKMKIIISGASGSGKDHLSRELLKKGFLGGIKWTTRPMRKFEKQGVEYNFVEDEVFNKELIDKKFLIHQSFYVTPLNDIPTTWYYGITMEEFKNKELFIMTPGEIGCINKELLKHCFIIYLDIDREIRKERIMKRDDNNDSVKRRLDSDDIDFNDFDCCDLRITDHNFNVDEVIESINKIKKTH